MAQQSPAVGAAPTPNDVFRRIRSHYFRLVAAAFGLALLALLGGTSKLAPPWFVGMLLLGGVAALIVSVMILRSAVCPTCMTPTMWRASPGLTSSRISLLLRPKCPSCGLDFDRPIPPVDAPASTPNPG